MRMLQQGLRARAGVHRGGRQRAGKQFDSSALAVLLECRREAQRAGPTASRSRGLSPRLRELAGLYGVRAFCRPPEA
jgi:phospholipid transport system transporter-binding protein